jgi:GNAT superfamily N-acetyltransferase
MWWRLTKAQFDAQKGEGNRKAMKAIVDSGQVPGILAYHRGEPVAWCSVAPRGHFPRLERSRLLRPIDREPVWSVVCFFVSRPHRRSGVATRLLRAAVAYAKTKGARIVEGYPVELKQRRYPDLFAYHGVASAFRRVGFKEAAHPSETRLVMRYAVE